MPGARPTVLVTESEYRKAEALFETAPGLQCLRGPDDEAGLASAIRTTGASHLVVGPLVYSGELYDALPPGGVIARFGVGHDGIDKARATMAGLLCTNTPGVLDESVAEHTMALIAAAARGLVAASTDTAGGAWVPRTGFELRGTTLAVIGCGNIGRAVARMATLGFGMTVVGCSRPELAPPSALEHFRSVTNDFAVAVCGADVVSLHLGATPDNAQYLNRDRLACLGAGAWLVNTARGWFVDEVALFEALAAGRLAGAALDVFAREPYRPVDGGGDLRSLPNVIMTPHIGSNTAAANRRMAERALGNIRLADAGAYDQMNLLNPEVVKAGG